MAHDYAEWRHLRLDDSGGLSGGSGTLFRMQADEHGWANQLPSINFHDALLAIRCQVLVAGKTGCFAERLEGRAQGKASSFSSVCLATDGCERPFMIFTAAMMVPIP
jgi:hypothetical protein